MSRWTTLSVVSDLHGDMQDEKAVSAFNKFCKQWNPDIRVFAGDLFDFRPLRHKATDDEKRESMKKDFEMGMEWLEWYRPNYFIRGNHDERLWELAEKDDGVRSDYAQSGVKEIEAAIKKMGCRMLPYHKRDGILRLGHLKVLHGFASGVYASRQHALVYGSCLFGHTHAIDEHAIPGLERRVARNIGCLTKLDHDYNARHMNTLKQAHGWAYGVINKVSGHYNIWQAEEIAGRYVLPSGIIEL